MNKHKFDGKATLYAAYRPTYSNRLIDDLTADLPQDAAIADIGSGTGKLTELLLDRGYVVFAVEPNADMRAAAEKSLGSRPLFRSVDASAEHTTLPYAGVSLVTAAQSFHWFDCNAFRSECIRILRPGGEVALIWNGYDEQAPATIALEETLLRHCPEFKGFRGGVRLARTFDDFFESYTTTTYPGSVVYDREAFLGRSLSSSYALAENDAGYGDYIAALNGYFDKFSIDGSLSLPLIAVCHKGEPKTSVAKTTR